MNRLELQLWYGCKEMNALNYKECMEMNAWDCKYLWKWMYFIEALYVCTLKFDCEWGNGMGPQGLGMVPWESPSGILSPTVPWMQWYWAFTGITGI